MSISISQGAEIVVSRWLKVREGDTLLIITDEDHTEEAFEMKHHAEKRGAFVLITVIPRESPQSGKYFDRMVGLLMQTDIIVGATKYSLITTQGVYDAVASGARFLSLPLYTQKGESMLKYDAITMDPDETKEMAEKIVRFLNKCETIRVTTKLGTNITFRKRNRTASFFNGEVVKERRVGSSSFEAYVAIEENHTNGVVLLDGSMGYIGAVSQPFNIQIRNGRIAEMEKNQDSIHLKEYIDSFGDPDMFNASEFGIGLNKKSRCIGESYVEDESAYGTFHIGFGRNIALGGKLYANGHYDLVIREPDIYAGDVKIMEQGTLIL
jgi:leucyl aminopeptidase (aminopeptidase T)